MEQLRELPGETAKAIEEQFLDFDDVQPVGSASASDSSAPDKIVLKRVEDWRARFDEWRTEASRRLEGIDIAPDLAEDIGSRRWFRGLGTMLGLSAVALALWPDFAPLEARPAMTIDQTARDEFRSHMILPLALGADSGRQMGAGPRVERLASAPERPQVELVATLSRGDSFERMLQRAGVRPSDAARVQELIAGEMPLDQIEPGTTIDITLGRRPAPGADRPSGPRCSPRLHPIGRRQQTEAHG